MNVVVVGGSDAGISAALRAREVRPETSVEGVLAAGDCVETWHRLLERPAWLPLGTTAHKQGRVAGENAVGGHATYQGTLGTQVVRVFGAVAGRTGLSHHEAAEAGYDPLTIELETWDHKRYFPGATRLYLRLTARRHDGRLLGAQLLGDARAEVSKRLDLFAMALHQHLAVGDLSAVDLSYTPPLSAPWDPIQQVAQDWSLQNR